MFVDKQKSQFLHTIQTNKNGIYQTKMSVNDGYIFL